MALNPSIILSQNAFDPTGAMDRGAMAAGRQNALARQTGYDQAVTQYGAQAIGGDQTAQNALAAYDPAMVQGLQSNSLGMQSQQLGMDQTRQNMGIQREELAMRREEARMQTQRQLAEQQGAIDMAAAAEDAAKLRKVLVGAAPLHAEGNEAAYNLFLQQNGIDPREYSMADFPMNAATMEGVLDAIEGQSALVNGPVVEPQSPAGKLAADIDAGILPAGTIATPETVVNNYEGGTGKQVFDRMITLSEGANAAVQGLRSIAEARAAVQGGIVSGFGADQVLGLQKLGAALGVVDPTAIQNTETFRSAIAPQVAALIKATVGSANISNADREFAEKAAGGAITLDAGSITRLLGIMETMNRATIENYQARLDSVYPPDNPAFAQDRALLGVNVPDAIVTVPPPSAGVSAAPGGNVTPSGVQWSISE